MYSNHSVIHLNKFLIGHFLKCDIMQHMQSMHLKFGYFVLYTPIYRLMEIKKRFPVQNCPCGTVGAKIGYVLELLMHGKVVVELGRKVFLVHNRKCHVFMQINIRELTRVIHQICAAIPQQYIHRYILSMSTQYLAVDATSGGCTKY